MYDINLYVRGKLWRIQVDDVLLMNNVNSENDGGMSSYDLQNN
jgi:hypothetical protein